MHSATLRFGSRDRLGFGERGPPVLEELVVGVGVSGAVEAWPLEPSAFDDGAVDGAVSSG